MSKQIPIIDQIRINKPCTADWNSMVGNDEVRFCEHCAKHVHNLSAITRNEAERLVENSNGKLCIRYYPLPDGGIETADSTRRLYPITRKISNIAAGLFSVALAASSSVLAHQAPNKKVAVSKTLKRKATNSINDGKSSGSISGTVFDFQGIPIPRADLELTNTSTEAVVVWISDDTGHFSFPGLDVGTYKLKVSSTGFRTDYLDDIRVSANENIEVESVLNIGGLMGMVVVVERPTQMLVKAAANREIATVAALLDSGMDVNSVDGYTRRTAIHEAVESDNLEMVELLLKHHAEVNLRDKKERTPLMLLGSNADVEIVELLLRNHSKVNLKDETGRSALWMAAEGDDPDRIKLLLKAGAQVDLANDDGTTPLMIAASEGNLECAQLLIAAGAKVNRRDKEGNTALKLAIESENDEIVTLLKTHGGVE